MSVNSAIMEAIALVTEGLSYTYKIPKDREQRLYDFYLLNLYKSMMGNSVYQKRLQSMPGIDDDTLKDLEAIVRDGSDRLGAEIREDLLDAMVTAVASEFRHVWDNNSTSDIEDFMKKQGEAKKDDKKKNPDEVFEQFKKWARHYYKHMGKKNTPDVWKRREDQYRKGEGASDVYTAASRAVKTSGWDLESFMKTAERVFLDINWPSNYGGKAWANIAQAWLNLKNAPKEEWPIWIDHVFDLEHNTGTMLNKVKRFKKNGGYSWIKKALDAKFDMSPIELAMVSSIPLSIAGRLNRITGVSGTVQDYDSGKDRYKYEYPDRLGRYMVKVTRKDSYVSIKFNLNSGVYPRNELVEKLDIVMTGNSFSLHAYHKNAKAPWMTGGANSKKELEETLGEMEFMPIEDVRALMADINALIKGLKNKSKNKKVGKDSMNDDGKKDDLKDVVEYFQLGNIVTVRQQQKRNGSVNLQASTPKSGPWPYISIKKDSVYFKQLNGSKNHVGNMMHDENSVRQSIAEFFKSAVSSINVSPSDKAVSIAFDQIYKIQQGLIGEPGKNSGKQSSSVSRYKMESPENLPTTVEFSGRLFTLMNFNNRLDLIPADRLRGLIGIGIRKNYITLYSSKFNSSEFDISSKFHMQELDSRLEKLLGDNGGVSVIKRLHRKRFGPVGVKKDEYGWHFYGIPLVQSPKKRVNEEVFVFSNSIDGVKSITAQWKPKGVVILSFENGRKMRYYKDDYLALYEDLAFMKNNREIAYKYLYNVAFNANSPQNAAGNVDKLNYRIIKIMGTWKKTKIEKDGALYDVQGTSITGIKSIIISKEFIEIVWDGNVTGVKYSPSNLENVRNRIMSNLLSNNAAFSKQRADNFVEWIKQEYSHVSGEKRGLDT